MFAEQIISYSFSPDQLGAIIRQAVKAELAEYSPPILPPNIPEVATRKQTAELLGVSVVTLSTWEKDKILIPNRISHRVRYLKADILQALSKRKKLNHKR
ncbi:helix-turn-helix domain-containing protein [Flavobacterium sp.]|uniref:helix-turn-helix domain-containing protein n=1 Tax=Flavobacterium sp. TaxID=239 RepID=UPI003750FD34